MSKPDWVRVRDARTGHRYTTTRAAAVRDPQRFQIITDDAVDKNGRVLPEKPLRKAPAAPKPAPANKPAAKKEA